MYFFFGDFVSLLGSSFCKYARGFFDAIVILSAVLLPIKSPVASAVFWIALFKAVFIAAVVDFLTFLTVFLA